ncbi:anti-phage dCTP deaminase [Bordetella trematum]|uniref:anti-phage dCTP deaminase n=1 Tax=Bordetella trematum TaxID=123899 RepID=UPI0015C55D40|nr:anti-phage dCTP deaminase [Bordetella trematum]
MKNNKLSSYAEDCELVIGLVAPVGINLEDVDNRLRSYFDQIGYKINSIRVSEIAASFFSDYGPLQEHERLDRGMNNGNKMRKKTERPDIFSLLAIDKIKTQRATDIESEKVLKRTVHVIRSLKTPDEVNTFRQVYGHGFFLLGISSSIESRKRYLTQDKGVPEGEIDRLIARDDKEKDDFGQNTRGVFQMADAFVDMDGEDLSDQLYRILDLIFSKPVSTPTPSEYAMFMAYAASLRSGDLSRQVGAVISNDSFDIISTGANDVPKFGGGLYWPGAEDQRDHVIGYDANENQKKEIIIKIMKKIDIAEESEDELLKKGKLLLKDTGILDITEYGRVVHAEMEALLCSARNGISTRGSILYTTTYPCHNCAKHIVAAGLKKVVYIEPYPKSYAATLHGDSIDSDGKGDLTKVVFKPFVGIGPRRFVDLFSISLGNGRKIKRKEQGRVSSWERRRGANVRVPMTPLSYIEAEEVLVNNLSELTDLVVKDD